jgi:hypothetical protein
MSTHKVKLLTLGENMDGFIIPIEYDGKTPQGVNSRDFWNAFNTCLREGTDGLGNEWVLSTDSITIMVHSAKYSGSNNGMIICPPCNEPGMLNLRNPISFDLVLKNGLVVVWDGDITVRQLRGAIL